MAHSISTAPTILPFVDEGLGNSSYLIEVGDGRALAVDPSRDPAPYLAEAGRRGLTIAFAAETHLHADFVSGACELAAAADTTVLGARADGRRFAHRGLDDGDEVDLGGLRLRALATPGHTPDHLAYLLLDGSAPLALFSGGSLLVGSVSRTDLIEPGRTEELARALYHSIHETLLRLPDDLAVYPTHGAGSFCSAPAGAERTTTVGRERAANPLLAAPDEDAFVARLLGSLGTYPTYFQRLAQVNRRGPRVYGGTPELPRIAVEDVRQMVAGGAAVIDARPVEDFAAGHIPGALSIHLRSAFATWLGWLAPVDRPLVFVLGAGQDRGDLVRQALKIGYELLAGELDGGMAAWRDAGLPLAQVAIVPPGALDGTVVDVRQASEYEAGHIPGAVLAELGSLPDHGLPAGPLTLTCAHGERAMTAASLLYQAGRTELAVMSGGADVWTRVTGTPLSVGW